MTYGRKFWMVVGVILLGTAGLYLDKLSGAEWVALIALIGNGYLFVNVLQKRSSVSNGQDTLYAHNHVTLVDGKTQT